MRSVLSAIVFALVADFARGQNATGPPMCVGTGFNWAFNSVGQSPCDITSVLGGVCNAGRPFLLPPVQPGLLYLGPTVQNQSACICSTVYYSTLSACAACQGADFLSWSTYSQACSAVYVTVFPSNLPPALKVPAWAYINVTITDNFNATAAQALGGVESTATPAPTGTSSSSTSSQTSSNQSGGSGKKSNAGAIAGGVIGGLVLLALIAGLVLWLLRRQKQARARSSAYNSVLGGQNDMSYAHSTFAVPSTIPTPKPYDPNDPSTFPTNDGSGYGMSLAPTPPPGGRGIAPDVTGTTLHTTAGSLTPARPTYTGAPEI